MNIQEIIEVLETQLNWVGPTGRFQGTITLPRETMSYLVKFVKSTSEYAQVANVKQN